MPINPLFQRLGLLLGADALTASEQRCVAVVGLGGVGSWCAEALVRSGLGRMILVDCDKVSASNINRQVQATTATIGRLKAEALRERLAGINPDCQVNAISAQYTKEHSQEFALEEADYIIDAIDILPYKLDLIEQSIALGKILFSSMGMAQKIDPTQIKTGDIWETTGCPLAKLVRSGLRKRNFTGHFTVVYSPERPLPHHAFCEEPSQEARDDAELHQGFCEDPREEALQGRINGSTVTVTATAGMILASLVVRDIWATQNGSRGRG